VSIINTIKNHTLNPVGPKLSWSGLFLIFVVFLAGIYLVLFRMMHADLSSIPGDLGDARLNNYFLEHGYKWLAGQVKSFWNAPFFYPTVRAMSFSDNHLGTLPIYALFRFFSFDRETSYQLWFFAIFALNYFSSAWVLRRFSINALGTAVGAFIFTFSLPVIAQIGHSQLLPRFMVPFAFYFSWEYLERPRIRTLALACLAIVVQFYCTMYIGFSLLLGLFSLLIAVVLLRENRLAMLREICSGSWQTIMLGMAIILLAIISLLPLIIPYYKTSLEYGVRAWEEIARVLPRINSYFYPSNGSRLWAWLRPIGAKLPVSWEHEIFVGAIPMIAFIVMPALYYRNRIEPLAKKGMIAFITTALLVVLTLYFRDPPTDTLYRLVLYIPGMSSIRSVTRIILLMLFPLSIIVGVVFTMLIENRFVLCRPFTKHVFSSLILFAVILDQNVKSSSYDRYSKTGSQNRSRTVEKLVQNKFSSAKVFAYMPDNTGDAAHAVHIDAMLAAQNLNISTVNGYSGIFPCGYYAFYKHFDPISLMAWKEISIRRYAQFGAQTGLFENIVVVGRDHDNTR